jgi:hypothetical protein
MFGAFYFVQSQDWKIGYLRYMKRYITVNANLIPLATSILINGNILHEDGKNISRHFNISSTCSWVSYGLAEGRKSVKEISHLSLFLLAQHAVKDDVKCWCPKRKVNLGWMNLRCARYILVCLNPCLWCWIYTTVFFCHGMETSRYSRAHFWNTSIARLKLNWHDARY